MGTIDLLINHRLRHLNGLSVHNLILKEDDTPPFSVCFALSLPHGDDLGFFYRSYDEWNCLHPEWRFIDLSNCSHLQQVAKDFVVSVLIRFENTGYCRLFRQWRIHITGLRCLGQDIPFIRTGQGSEEFLILQFGDFFYTTYKNENAISARDAIEPAVAKPEREKLDFNLLVRADDSNVRESYPQSVLSRIAKLTEDYMKVTQALHKEEETCVNAVAQSQTQRHQKTELEVKRSRLKVLQQQVDNVRERVATRRNRYSLLKQRNADKEAQLLEFRADLRAKIDNLQTAANVYQRMRSDLKEYQIQIVRRRLVLARALQVIYPIKKIVTEGSSTSRFSICNLELPDSDDFSDTSFSEGHLTAAYGFAAQLLHLLSYITDVSLRYPIVVHHRSRLYVRDNIVCQLDQEERNFPLHLKRQRNDRIRFAYAVFLINRNISLLRLACGLTLKNMQSTLNNLSELLRSPLTPSCSAETYRAAEKMVEEASIFAVVGSQPSVPASVVEEAPMKSKTSNRTATSGMNSDIYFQGDVVDLAT